MPADFVIAPPAIVAVPVAGGGTFPVRRVFCVGRNYAEHAREMGHDPDREPPFFFSKPADALVTGGADVPYPTLTSDLHHEIELVAAIGTGGADITVADALNHIWGYAVGLDLTRRDIQQTLRKAGRPWDMAKGFDASAPIGEMVAVAEVGHPANAPIELRVNGETRQSGNVADMIWSLPEVIAELSRYVKLAPGDLIFTGTPAGVAAVVRGDRLEGSVAGIGTVSAKIT
ncbi:MAG TPA: fumarylacetoacetate hydrolase family protein [Devosiaceae bacterium]|nr:fumarylacetoacetate hydrolase family protein [Devosiaceae bacterium]